MKAASFGTDHRSWVLVMELGEEVLANLKSFVIEKNIRSASFTAIGAFSDATLAFFDWETSNYEPIRVGEQVELASCIGDVAISSDGSPALHAHVVVGKRSGLALAGHLLEGRVRPTLELVLTELPSGLQRVPDRKTGLALLQPERKANAAASGLDR